MRTARTKRCVGSALVPDLCPARKPAHRKRWPYRLFISSVLAAMSPLAFLLGGCVGREAAMKSYTAAIMQSRQASDAKQAARDARDAKRRLRQELASNPDLEPWHEQRLQMMLSVGDRVFDKSFNEVFDGMIIALASLGCRVNNMERSSGYITASLPDLGPERIQALSKEALAEYARVKGYPPTVLHKPGASGDDVDDDDLDVASNVMMRMGSGLTLTIAKQSPTQTKVKLRFDRVYFPKTNQELYRAVWVAVDKQIFLNQALDTPRT